MLAHVPAHAADQSSGASVGADAVHDLGDGVGAIVVAGPAMVSQPARDGQRPGIMRGDAQRVARHLHSAGETAVQVQVIDPVDPQSAGRGQPLAAGGDRRRAGQIRPLGDEPVIVAVCRGQGVHPAFRVDAQPPGLGHGHHYQRGGLIHRDEGVHVLGVGRADHAIFG